MADVCPCCQRPFEKMLDYPLVAIREVAVLPIPEVIDLWSDAAQRARLERERLLQGGPPMHSLPFDGINRTPEVAAAYESLADYFRSLEARVGRELSPHELAPPLEPDARFRWAYRIPASDLYVSLSEAESASDGGAERRCAVVIHGPGPNFGSAGGPTLQPFGAVASIRYEGRLVGPCAS